MQLTTLGKLVRAKEWLKNMLVFIPLFFSGLFTQAAAFTATAGTAVLFCLIASFVYIFNDIKDLEKDKNHRIKQQRPLAANLVTIPQAWLTGCILLLLATLTFYFLKQTLQPLDT